MTHRALAPGSRLALEAIPGYPPNRSFHFLYLEFRRRLKTQGSFPSEAAALTLLWRVPFQIRGAGSVELLDGYGVDTIQAVINALEGIRVTLAKSGQHLTWVGGRSGDTGFPRVVPDIGSPQLRHRIEQLTDREVERFVRALERKHRRRHHQGASAPRRAPVTSRRTS